MNLNQTEVADALAKLSPADFKRIKYMAQAYAHGLASLSHEDLMQEAYSKLLSEDRVFPADHRPVTVIINVMHSISSNCRDREISGAVNHYAQSSTISQSIDDEDSEGESMVMAVEEITPEKSLEDKQDFSAIEAMLNDDSELLEVATAWALEVRGSAAAAYLGWDMARYDAARVRLFRRLKVFYKE